MAGHLVCISFDFDAMSGMIARGADHADARFAQRIRMLSRTAAREYDQRVPFAV